MKPAEFRYRENAQQPSVRRLRSLTKRLLRFDPAPPQQVIDSLSAMYFDGDDVAAALVRSSLGASALREARNPKSERSSNLPQEVETFLDDIERQPDWVDRDLVERGARAFRRFGPAVFRFAGTITLAGYAENSVAQPLIQSGAYVGDSTRRRFLETVSFWIAVSEPGGLEPGANGLALALRVRVMHAGLRQKLSSSGRWDEAAWGKPISTADALLTLMGGSVAPALALAPLGHLTSPAEIRALLHFWRYVGHLMGVRPSWFPVTWQDVVQLGFVVALKSARLSGEDGRALCRSYANAFKPSGNGSVLERVRAAIEHRVHLGYTRLFLLPHLHARNGLPKAGPWVLAPFAPLPLTLLSEILRRLSPSLEQLVDKRARRKRKRWLERRRIA